MLGQVHLFSSHRGDLFEEAGTEYALLNGQALSRSAYSALGAIWPSGAYGSTDTAVVLPDVNNLYLRGVDFGSGRDPDVGTRTAISGTTPTTTSVGSYQTGAMRFHEHAGANISTIGKSGTTFQRSNGITTTATFDTTVLSGATLGTVVSGSTESSWEPAHMKVFPYMTVT